MKLLPRLVSIRTMKILSFYLTSAIVCFWNAQVIMPRS